jgi:hypothetical protein
MSTSTTDHLEPSRLRRLAGAACMVGLPLSLLATGPLDPFDDQAKASVQLGQVPGHLGQIRALGWVELLSAALMIGVLLAFAGLTRGRGRGVANAGVVVGALATLGLVLVGVHHWVLAAVGAEANGARILDRLDSVAGPGVMVLILLGPLALLLLAIGGFRAGFVPLPALVLVGVAFLGELTPSLPGGELVPLLLLLVGFGWTAASVVRRPVVPALSASQPSQPSLA